jgi:hypothetical protein
MKEVTACCEVKYGNWFTNNGVPLHAVLFHEPRHKLSVLVNLKITELLLCQPGFHIADHGQAKQLPDLDLRSCCCHRERADTE